MATIIVCCAHKGGVGKTVTVHNLSYALSRMGKRVLAVDFDDQANLTTCFGIDAPEQLPVTIADLMDMQIRDEDVPDKSQYVQHCDSIDLLASSLYLSTVSDAMHLEMGSERFLANILNPLRDDYDYIIVDTGPKLDNLTINALIAADELIIAVEPQYLSTTGLNVLYGTIKKIKHRFNPSLEVAGILLTMCHSRTNLCKIMSQQIREEFQTSFPIFHANIPYTIKMGEAVYNAQSIFEYAPSCPAATAYRNFAVELDSQINHVVPLQIHRGSSKRKEWNVV